MRTIAAARLHGSMVAAIALVALSVFALRSSAAGAGAPVVSAGADQTVTVADPVLLRGTVSDDGLPAGLNDLRWTWSRLSGPATVAFDETHDLLGVARFTATGTYTFRLTVTDGALSASDDVVVTVLGSASSVIRVPQDFATIQAAVNAASPGALVLVSQGTYTETVTIPKTITLASTYYTTGNAAVVDQTIIQAPSAAAETVIVDVGAGPETMVYGFKVTTGNNGILARAPAKVVANHVTAVATDAVEYLSNVYGLVERNTLEANGDDGVDLNYSEVVVRNNMIRSNNGDGIEFRLKDKLTAASSPVFRGNDIVTNKNDGLQLIDQDTTVTTASRIIVDRNTLAGNLRVGLGLLDGAVSAEDYRAASLLERIIVTNNTITGNNYGITGGDNMSVVNNVITNNTTAGLKQVDGGSTATYNIFFGNGVASDASNVDAAHTLNANPLLDGTYHLGAGSPAIDAGIASLTINGEPIVQLTGSHYSGTAPDLGRYETAASPPANTAPTVSAGADKSIALPTTSTSLAGTVTDDGKPTPPGTTTKSWTQVSGPAGVTFGTPTATTTTATFPGAGTYTLRLTASDSALSAHDDVAVTVTSAGNVAPVVSAGPDLTITLPTVSATLTGSVTDDALPNPPATTTKSWTQVGRPGRRHLRHAVDRDHHRNLPRRRRLHAPPHRHRLAARRERRRRRHGESSEHRRRLERRRLEHGRRERWRRKPPRPRADARVRSGQGSGRRAASREGLGQDREPCSDLGRRQSRTHRAAPDRSRPRFDEAEPRQRLHRDECPDLRSQLHRRRLRRRRRAAAPVEHDERRPHPGVAAPERDRHQPGEQHRRRCASTPRV